MKKYSFILLAFLFPLTSFGAGLTYDTGNATYTGSASSFSFAFNPADNAVLVVLSIGFNNGDVTGLSCTFDGETFHEKSTQVSGIVANHTLILSGGDGDAIATTGNIACSWTTSRYTSITVTSWTGATAIYMSKVVGSGSWSTNPTTINATAVTLTADDTLIGSISDDKAVASNPTCSDNDRQLAVSGGGATNQCNDGGSGSKQITWIYNTIGNPNNYLWNELIFSGVASTTPTTVGSTTIEECYYTNGTSTCSLMQELGNIRFIALIILVLALLFSIERFYYLIFAK